MDEATGIEPGDCFQIAKITVVGSSEGLGPLPFNHGFFFTKFKVLDMNFSCGTGPNVNQNLVGYPCNRHATILPAGIAFLVGWFISCKTVDFLP